MKDHPADPYSQHQEIFLLLPWYVNNSLHDDELKAVEKHLKVCLSCKRELAAQQKLAASVKTTDVLESAAQASFSRLKTSLHLPREAAGKLPPTAANKSSRRFAFHFFSLPQPAMAMMAALVMMVVIPGYYFSNHMQTATYRTLANSEPEVTSNRDIRVIFAKGTSGEQIHQALATINAQIIEGPSSDDLYLIRLAGPANNADQPDFDALLSLRNNAIVVFAEPAHHSLSFSRPRQEMTR